MNSVRKFIACLTLAGTWTSTLWAIDAIGDPFEITKDVWYASGSDDTGNGTFDLGFTVGEEMAGPTISGGKWELDPGYYGGGRLGTGTTLRILNTTIAPGTTPLHQDTLQVGVPVNATAAVLFGEAVDPATLAAGVQVYKMQDHLGSVDSQSVVPVQVGMDAAQTTLTVTPVTPWEGNTLYSLALSTGIRSVSGYSLLTEARTLYLTLLDPVQNNLVLQSPNAVGSPASAVVSGGGVTLNLPAQTLSDYAAILTSKDPQTSPLRVDPKIIADATSKAQAASPYRVPLLLRELSAFDTQGHITTRLSKPSQLTIGVGGANASSLAAMPQIRPQTLSLWTLDETHHLWIKMPGSGLLPDGSAVVGTVANLAVFAVMGDAQQSASDVYAFPVPWRPHGPQAGTDVGQTGTESGGITFAALPSECKIRIFNLTGELVRELQHSDIGGTQSRETWDVKTTHGASVASGVYFWRVESAVDGKNGKLMVIR